MSPELNASRLCGSSSMCLPTWSALQAAPEVMWQLKRIQSAAELSPSSSHCSPWANSAAKRANSSSSLSMAWRRPWRTKPTSRAPPAGSQPCRNRSKKTFARPAKHSKFISKQASPTATQARPCHPLHRLVRRRPKISKVELPDRYNVAADLLTRNLEAGRASKVAIHSAAGDVTYGALARLTSGAAQQFLDHGVRREERILIVGFDSPGWVASFLGAIRIGAVPVPVNPLLQRSEDYLHYIEDSLARVIVVDQNSEEKLKAAAKDQSLLRADQLEPADEVPPAPTRKDDMAFWLYSSGSTGKPKAVVHLQHDIPYTCVTYAEQVLGITAEDTTFSTTGLFHAYGFGNNLTFPYWVGASTVLHAGRHTPQTVLDTIEAHKPTLFFSAPTLYNAILNFEGAKSRNLSSIRLCVAAAEALPAEVWRRWKDAFGLTILDGVGSTEMLHIYCCNRLDDLKHGSSGQPAAGYERKVLH